MKRSMRQRKLSLTLTRAAVGTKRRQLLRPLRSKKNGLASTVTDTTTGMSYWTTRTMLK